MDLNSLKNNYAIEQGYEDWGNLYRRSRDYIEAEFFKHENAVFILVQKAALEKAAENAEVHRLNLVNGGKCTGKNIVSLSGERTIFSTHKESITNEENLIL